jgi:hypothetical protein
MAQFWIAIFFIFLAVAQLYQSIKDINLPLPVYLILGAMLAVASNAQQQLSFIPAAQTTPPEISASDPLLSLSLPTEIASEDNKPVDSNASSMTFAAALPSQNEVMLNDDIKLIADHIKAVESDAAPVTAVEPLPPQTEVVIKENVKAVTRKKSNSAKKNRK